MIAQAYETRGVIVLTDPDFPGDKIRNTIKNIFQGLNTLILIEKKLKVNVVK